MTDTEADLDHARRLLHGAQRVTVLTGAGISTDSGIADFRGPQGLWTKDPEAEKTSHISYFLSDPAIRVRAWANRMNAPTWAAQPNAGHRALVDLERSGRLVALLTQNIDGLHQLASSDPALVVEVHGTMREVVCLSCGDRNPVEHAFERVRNGEADPPCLVCGGILKSATISFGQSLVHDDLVRADQAARSCDLLLAVGTTLAVHPIADVVPLAASHGADIVILNGERTEMDDLATVLLRGAISDVLPALVEGISALD
jgi:NAD-dependent deacetylase